MSLRQAAQQALEALEKVKTDADKQPPVYPWDIWRMWVDRAITNLRAALAEPQTTHWEGCEAVHPECRKPEPVVQLEFAGTLPISRGGYAPTPRKPLTEGEIDAIEQRVWGQTVDKGKTQGEYAMKFARAIERAHGIGEQHGS